MTSAYPHSSDPNSLDNPRVNATSVPAQRHLVLFRRIGYGLLGLSFVDLLYVLLPPDLTNPVWEYQIIGDLVRLIPVPLLALTLVFYGEAIARRKLEKYILWLLSWLTVVIAVIFFLLIPLTISDTVQISRFNNEQISSQVNQQKSQLDATQQQLEKASPDQLQNLVPVPDQDGNLPDAPDTPEQAKAQVLLSLEQARQQAETQGEQARNNLRQNLLKNTTKLTVQLLIGGFIYLYLWSMTSWARRFTVSHPSTLKPMQSKQFRAAAKWMQALTRQGKRSLRPRGKQRG